MLVGTAGVAWWIVTMPRPLPAEALERVPGTTPAVLWLDVAPVLRSKLVRRLLAQEGHDEGLRRIERECGFDPLEQVSDAVVFVHGDRADELESIGVVARGALDHER